MEQEGESREVIDLSQALEENHREPATEEEVQYKAEQELQRIPGVYRLIMKCSGGLVKTEGQAKAVAVLIIILTNLVTFSLLFKGKTESVPQEEIPADAMSVESK